MRILGEEKLAEVLGWFGYFGEPTEALVMKAVEQKGEAFVKTLSDEAQKSAEQLGGGKVVKLSRLDGDAPTPAPTPVPTASGTGSSSKGSKEDTKQAGTLATSNIVSDYFSYHATKEQQDTIIKVVVIIAIMLVLITRIKNRK